MLIVSSCLVRMQAHYPDGSPYRNTRHAFATVWREGATQSGTSTISGGLRSLYRGVDATTVRGVVLSVSQICSYDQIKQTLKKKGVMEEGFSLHFTASMFAGFICSVTSNPVGKSLFYRYFSSSHLELNIQLPGWTIRCCQSARYE